MMSAVTSSVRAIGNVAVLLTVGACAMTMAISTYPGVLGDLLFLVFLLAIPALPLVLVAGVVALVLMSRRGMLKGWRFPWRHAGVIAAIALATGILLWLHMPRRLAFAISCPAFERRLATAPMSASANTSLRRRLGFYRVDEYAADPRGGVYFRVYSGPDGLGPDRMSHGFAYRPNTQGTPFGAASYRVYRLNEDWFWFHASDDWH